MTRLAYVCTAYDDNGNEIKRTIRHSTWGPKGAENGFRSLLTELVLLSETARIEVTPTNA